ncbi:family 28 putative glycosyltransferase [Talaromyces proteolyticus]|uniref:UDP-N-acetylglucosamine transferase subunit ALG13 n=1 Tax=Talaromyces proteolyticus TaxID=1131652 RepID=A0AAD4KVC9_9EURO|nr:family 28 putative glycosyltransferase [Talaromyces proteolyticus]KAH8701923.1 family 28 putative glycosyltransferase [Talaromyces proteolyticus]
MSRRPRKVCFVTIGATAPFDVLLSNVLNKSFLEALQQHEYTTLVIQYGKEGRAVFDKFTKKHAPGSPERCGLDIQGFGFKQDGLLREMRLTKSDDKLDSLEGMILSHAGSGSIMEALRIGVPLVVVPNPALQDNHQEELAREIEKNGWAVTGRLDNLAQSVEKAEDLRRAARSWPPVNSGETKYKRGLAGVMEDEMGFVD